MADFAPAPDLFEDLRTALGLSYLSQLPEAFAGPGMARALAELPLARYTVWQWQDLYRYLLNSATPAGAESVRSALLAASGRPR